MPLSQQQTQANLRTILTSIGDAVLVTDKQGRVTLLNPVAEQLTGWTTAEAVGLDSRRVFDIMNGVENPVDRVLREGIVVSLADHTLLRRRDGTEVPIDDSAAPVRDEAGNLVGVVLVFRDISERQATEAAFREQARLAALGADIGIALTQSRTMEEALGRCANVVVQRLDAAFARLWTLDDAGTALELKASAGMYTHLDGPHGRVPVGKFKIGLIAQERLAHLTNTVVGDPRVSDQEWAQREGMVAFAGYPLLVEDRLVGVLAMFARHRLTDDTLRSLESVAHGIALDIDRRQAEDARAAAEERLRLATQSTQLGTWDYAPASDTLFWDAQCRAIFDYPLDLPIDYPTYFRLIHADDRERVEASVTAALSPHGTDEFQVEFRTAGFQGGKERWVQTEGKAYFDAAHTQTTRFVGISRDITAHKQVEKELVEARHRLEAALTAGDIATWTLDLVENRLFPDIHFAPLFGVAPEYATGGTLDVYLAVIHPDDQPLVVAAIESAVAEAKPYAAEYRVVLPDGTVRWLSARGTIEYAADGTPVSMPGVIVNITERIQREMRERFLADLTAQTRALLDPEEILYETAKAVGEFTNAHRAQYIEIDEAADRIHVRRDYVRDGVGMKSFVGSYPLSSFGAFLVTSLQAGIVTQISDTETDSRFSPEHRAAFRAANFQSFISAPLHKDGRLVAVLALHYASPRVWTAEEAEMLTAVVERTWLAVENARLFRETQQRAEREALLNEIGEKVRITLDPEAILRATVEVLGRRLGVDRCYFVRYDQVRNTARVFPEWFRAEAGLEPLGGTTRQMAAYSVNRDPAFVAGRTSLVNDTQAFPPEEASPLLALGIRALMRVPIAVGSQMTALGVAIAEPRVWSAEEVRLLENVAALLRSALASAHIQQRERNIAIQLQESLQPPAPNSLPGLALASYYRPALAEANVGGDFFDVFPLEAGHTALVVADLSGKGLAAASQVATVRNMLRFALYSQPDLAAAVTGLHRALVQYGLLTGFATLFVSVFDETNQTLTYVNCGQEPGLIWRVASRTVESLPPTGPVLGGFGTGDYEQAVVDLTCGDVLALFTDGLTEVGPSRKFQLEIEGVSDILRDCLSGEAGEVASPQTVVDCLISGVDDFGRGGSRDDIALLVGRVVAVEKANTADEVKP